METRMHLNSSRIIPNIILLDYAGSNGDWHSKCVVQLQCVVPPASEVVSRTADKVPLSLLILCDVDIPTYTYVGMMSLRGSAKQVLPWLREKSE